MIPLDFYHVEYLPPINGSGIIFHLMASDHWPGLAIVLVSVIQRPRLGGRPGHSGYSREWNPGGETTTPLFLRPGNPPPTLQRNCKKVFEDFVRNNVLCLDGNVDISTNL